MRKFAPIFAILALVVLATPSLLQAGYPARFRGVCQDCGRDLIAYYRPVQCRDGGAEWQWVNERHHHCIPACKTKRKKFDFFNSNLMNPANPKRGFTGDFDGLDGFESYND